MCENAFVQDDSLDFFFEGRAEDGVPVKLLTGMIAVRQGMPGGGGVYLGYENPIPYVNDVLPIGMKSSFGTFL